MVPMLFVFDGLTDVRELAAVTVKTPRRYPLPDLTWTYSDPMTPSVGAPAWAIESATLMTGVTHPDMGSLQVKIWHQDAT